MWALFHDSTGALRIANLVLAALCLTALVVVLVAVAIDLSARRRPRVAIPDGWPPDDADTHDAKSG